MAAKKLSAHRLDGVQLHRYADLSLSKVGGPFGFVVQLQPLAHDGLSPDHLQPGYLGSPQVRTAEGIPLLRPRVQARVERV